MAEITLVAETGREAGSRSSRRLRAAEKVPGVVYGQGAEPVAVAVDRRELRAVLVSEGTNAIVTLDLAGDRVLTLLKDVQRNALSRRVDHVDFQRVSADQLLTVEVPLVLVGEAVAVEREGGIVTQQLSTLTVQARPGQIPGALEVDVSTLEIGGQINVGDLDLPEGASTEVPGDQTIAVAEVPRAAVEAVEEVEEGLEGAEGEEAGESAPDAAGDSGGDSGDDSGD